ncbi:MAG: methyltransferase domain-containing protein [Proteobacteria bacterium]|nr:methyltransferase domain-containing protein [Pseudomonadota bacterium]MDA1357325.1 methyltransferase domain-containing protein [Pseudomonadota bacterium]
MMRLPSLPSNLVTQSHLTKRLQAWWAGYYYEPEQAAEPAPDEFSDAQKSMPIWEGRRALAWSDPRLQVTEEIWGKGYLGPGGDEEIEALIRPLGLNSGMMIIDFGAGLGGTTRALHNQTGAWVSGFEASPLLAEAGAELSHMAGLGRKAMVKTFDLESLDLRDGGFNTVFSKDALFTIDNKEAIFKKFYECLRNDGQLVLTDYLAVKPSATSTAIEEWAAQEPARPVLWSLDQTRAFISELGFEVSITEDVTATVRAQILSALAKFSEKIAPESKARPGWAPAIIAEIEMWANRIKVFDSGDVAIFRIYGRKSDPALR